MPEKKKNLRKQKGKPTLAKQKNPQLKQQRIENVPTVTQQEDNIPPEDLPENNIPRIYNYLFPCGLFIPMLEERGFHDVDLQSEGEQVYTYNLQMRAGAVGLTVPALRQHLAQTAAQIPALGGVTWRVGCIVALIEGQTVRAQFKVAYLEQPGDGNSCQVATCLQKTGS